MVLQLALFLWQFVSFKSETTIKTCAAQVKCIHTACCIAVSKPQNGCYACIYYAVALVIHCCERVLKRFGGHVVNEAKFLSPPNPLKFSLQWFV